MVFCLTRSMYMSVTLFWIAVFLRVLPYDFMTLRPAGFPIFPVDSCPRNLSAVETATLRLNCSEVKEFKNVYHCLPLSNLSLLVEFCYDGVSGLIEKVPSCIQINKQNSCYLADPRCPPVRGIADTTTILMGENETATTNNSDDVKLSLAVLTPIIVISLIITLGVMWNRGRHKFCNKDKYSGLSEETTPLKVNECKTHLEDENNKKIYEKYLKEGCIWVCPISQIIIVGENGVGKTTLLNRLKGKTLKEIKDIKSTRGIECHTKKESFIISGNELKLNKDGISSLPVDLELIQESNKETSGIRNQQEHSPTATQTSKENNGVNTGDKHSEESLDETLEVNKKHNSNSTGNKRQGIEMKGNMKANQRNKGKGDDVRIPESHLKPSEENVSDESEDISKWIQNITEEFEKRKRKTPQSEGKDDVVLEVLDFAGQGVYYASHQTFIRRNAIFIVVVDLSKAFNEKQNQKPDKRKDHHFKDLCDRRGVLFDCWSPREYLFYWLNTIRTHGGNAKHILFVGTHKDQSSSDSDFYKVLNEAVKKKLLADEYYSPITTDLLDETNIESDLQKIKDHICKIIDVKSCEREKRPAKWIMCLHIFEIITLSNPLVEIEKLLGITDHSDLEMDDDEINDMLHFFHNCGKIMFFNVDKLKDFVILDIQWFVNCFKHIISDREHVIEDFKDLEDETINGKMCHLWNTFQEKGILHHDLYHFLLNKNTNKISSKHLDVIGKYQEKLGMMLHIEKFPVDESMGPIDGWYIPCINSQGFSPNVTAFGSEGSSSILCFKFREYLPHDLFGRMIVLCVNSELLKPYNHRFFKNGADMCFTHSNNSKEQIYIFHYREFITVQFIGDNTGENGPTLRRELNRMIYKIICNFYSDALEYEVGFLCCKKNGYQEELVHHFVSVQNNYCQGCSRRISDVSEIRAFWFDGKREEPPPIPNTQHKDYIRNICEIYSKVLKQSTEITDQTRTEEKVIIQEQGNGTWLDELVEIGQTLKRFLGSIGDRKLNEDEETELKNIYSGLKKVSSCLNKVFKGLRKEIFFLWTQKIDSAQSDQDIPMLSSETSDENVQIGTDVTIEAKAELVRHFQWLRKTCQENKYRFLQLIEEEKDKFEYEEKKDRLVLKIRNFGRQDAGSYYVAVETENGVSVFRKTLRFENGKNDMNGSDLGTTPIEEINFSTDVSLGVLHANANAKPEKMEIKHLSGGKSVECDVKAVQSVAGLKKAVAKALNSPKEFIEIVDNNNILLYQDDTHFEDFLKHEDKIHVIERPRTRESQHERPVEIVEDDNESTGFPYGCTHSNNPEGLFYYIHSELMEREGIQIGCPNCGTKLVMDDAFKLCNMSDDEMYFYKEKIKRNWTWKQQMEQMRMY